MVINTVLVIASVVKIISYKATVILVVLVCLWKILRIAAVLGFVSMLGVESI